ncbi:MAG: response regulator [Planctomycetota bacterium]
MPHPPTLNSQTVAGLRVSDLTQHTILQELEAGHGERAATHDRRGCARRALPPQFVVKLLIHQPGGTTHKFRVRARNLGDAGIAVLHGGFLHRGSVCRVEIFDAAMPLVSLPARVVHCRYVRQTVHEIGLVFDEPIDSDAVQRSQKPAAPDAATSTPDRPALPRLRGRVLHVDPIEADRRYLGFRLAQLGLNFRYALTTPEALSAVKAQAFDLVLCEYRLRPDPAPFLLRRLRGMGCVAPVVVLGHGISRVAAKELTDLGAHACLPKPFRAEDLTRLLAQLLPEASPEPAEPARLSDHWAEESFRPLIIEYVGELGGTLDYLQRTVLQSASEADALQTAEQLAATASLYGFPGISEAAKELSTILALEPLPTDMICEQLLSLRQLADAAQAAIG